MDQIFLLVLPLILQLTTLLNDWSLTVKPVRVGHPARLRPQVLDSALDAQVLRGDNSSLENDIRKEMKALNGKLLKAKERNTKRDIRKEFRMFSREERKRQQLDVTCVIKNVDVVLTTLTGSLTKKLDGKSFDLVIIDEAAQALEVACLIALLKRGAVYMVEQTTLHMSVVRGAIEVARSFA